MWILMILMTRILMMLIFQYNVHDVDTFFLVWCLWYLFSSIMFMMWILIFSYNTYDMDTHFLVWCLWRGCLFLVWRFMMWILMMWMPTYCWFHVTLYFLAFDFLYKRNFILCSTKWRFHMMPNILKFLPCDVTYEDDTYLDT